MASKKYTCNKEDLTKIGVGALVALGGALLTYCGEVITEIDLGQYTEIVVAISAIVINTCRKYLAGK